MHTIYKYPVPYENTFQVDMPAGAQVLTVQMQRGEPQMWALVDTEADPVARQFAVVGTGHDVPPELIPLLAHVGTFLIADDNIVVHLFEIVKLRPGSMRPRLGV